MGRRRFTTPKEIRDLPQFRSSSGGVNIRSYQRTRGMWELSCSGRTRTITCWLRLASWQLAQQGTYGDSLESAPYWELHISRVEDSGGKLGRQFTAALGYCDQRDKGTTTQDFSNAPSTHATRVCVGTATSWVDAIDVVGTCGDVHLAMQELGSYTYGEGARHQWGVVRIFKVKYPWRDPAEPNALYTPFTLVGPYGFDADSDGAVVCCFELRHAEARRFAEAAGANAFLLGPKKDAGGIPRYKLYHREGMTQSDPIDIDDWRARIIAGTRD